MTKFSLAFAAAAAVSLLTGAASAASLTIPTAHNDILSVQAGSAPHHHRGHHHRHHHGRHHHHVHHMKSA